MGIQTMKITLTKVEITAVSCCIIWKNKALSNLKCTYFSKLPGHHKLSASSGIGNHRLRDRNHQCHRHTGGSNSKTDTESSSAYSSYIGLSSNGASSTEPKSKSKPVTTQTLGSKLVRQRDRNGISRKQRLHAKINGRMDNKCTTMKIPIYESKRTVSYNYGLPQSSFPSHQKKWV